MTTRENKSEISVASTAADRSRHLVLVCRKRDFHRADAVGSDFCPAERLQLIASVGGQWLRLLNAE